MVEMSNLSLLRTNSDADLELNRQARSSMSDYLRDLAKRDEHEMNLDVDEEILLNAIQQLMLVMPKLSLRIDANGPASDKSSKPDATKEMCKDDISGRAVLVQGDVEKKSLAKLSRLDLTSGEMAMQHDADGYNIADIAKIKQNDELKLTSLDADLAQKMLKSSMIEAKLRDSQASASWRHTEVARASMADAVAASADMGENGLRYSFRTWGKQHAVTIVTTPGMDPQALSASSALVLQPTSALVEQRLHVYEGMTDAGDRWLLQEHDREQQQDGEGRRDQDGDEA